MPAHMNPMPTAASAVAQIAAVNGGPVDSAAASPDENGRGPFAALFQQLLGKQAATDGMNAELAVMPAQATAEADTDEVASELDALIPFLEAFGITQQPVEQATESEYTAPTAETAQDAALAALAVPVTPAVASGPAISAVKPEAVMSSSTPAESVVTNPAASPLITSIQPKELSAGRDFSSQLVAAVESAREQPQTPGSIAAAAHQVIASDSPRTQHVPPSLPVSQSVGAAHWNDEIGQKIVWMANRMESRADLVLTPPQMGRVEVSLSVSGEHATANFVSGNPAVREALEAALPRLREVLADAGIQLGQAQVGAENTRQSAQQDKTGDNFAGGNNAAAETAARTATGNIQTAGLKLGRGLVDVFA